MNYEEFKEYLIKNIAGAYADMIISEQVKFNGTIDNEEIEKIKSCEVVTRSVLKNNGVKMDVLSIYREGEQVSPNIYLRPYYEKYILGMPTDMIMTEIISQYRNELKGTEVLHSPDLSDYDDVKDKIIVRLINKARNKEMLDDCPHLEYLDLAIVFRYVVTEDKNGMATILIGDREFESWGITLDELYQQALSNTVNMYPYVLEPLQDIVLSELEGKEEQLPEEIKEEVELLKSLAPQVKMYVLTNVCKAFGASVILYNDVIRNIAKVNDCNIFILPSSVHESMIVLEHDDTDPKFLKELLVDANRSSVGLLDLLGDNIYYYDRKDDCISVYDAA